MKTQSWPKNKAGAARQIAAILRAYRTESLLYLSQTVAQALAFHDIHNRMMDTTRALMLLAKNAKILQKRYENACNYEWACTPKYEKRTEKIEANTIAAFVSLGLPRTDTLALQRDPRGWPLIFKIAGHEMRLG